MIGAVLDLLVPLRCVSCRDRAAPPWCRPCAASVASLELGDVAVCPRCAGALDDHACWAGPAPVRRCTALYRYGGAVADAIVAGKVGGQHAVWAPLGAALARAVDVHAIDVVTWVPAPDRRRRQRGFDHAELLARAVAGGSGRPAWRLLRAVGTPSDRGAVDAAARPGVAPGTYAPAASASGARVLLVDDVLTTGATLLACAAALRVGGAIEVDAATVARAGAHRLGGPTGQTVTGT